MMSGEQGPIHGRGAASNPANRFEPLAYEPEPATADAEDPAAATRFYKDHSRSIIATNESPDVGFDASINPYRGCEHGCIYCYARPTHEYLGLSAGLDFETRILVKEDAPLLLRRELAAPRWQPRPLGVSGVTDAYQPIERRLQLTRRCLEVLAEFRNPVVVVTKSHLVTRDLDLLACLAAHQAAALFLSLTTLDGELSRVMEPRATQPPGRLAAIEAAAKAGVPVGVLIAPVIPGLNDHEIPALLAAAAAAGATFAGFVALRLPHAVASLFEAWLAHHFPDRKDKILGRIRDLRGGKLNDARFGHRMRGEGPLAQAIKDLFRLACRKANIRGRGPRLSAAAFRRHTETQPLLFELDPTWEQA
jgi:DNA repair photolyase